MTKETIILKTKLANLFSPAVISHLVSTGYVKTSCKFWIEFMGSKGYLSHLVIGCEGPQIADNRLYNLFNKNGSVKKITVNVFYSEINGIRLSTGNDEARVVQQSDVATNQQVYEDDLPF